MIKFKDIVILVATLCAVFAILVVIETKGNEKPYDITFIDTKVRSIENDDIITNMQSYMYKTIIEKLNS